MSFELHHAVDEFGVVHYDSEAKQTYAWPLCSTPHTASKRLRRKSFVTCMQCIARLRRLEVEYADVP